MDIQIAFNIAVAIVAFLGGWVLNSLKDSINQLKKTDGELADKVQHIEVLVAGQYVKRDSRATHHARIFPAGCFVDRRVLTDD